MKLKSLFKIGKKLCFPEAPSSWIPRTVEAIQENQGCGRRRKDLSLHQYIVPMPPALSSTFYDYEEKEEKKVTGCHCGCPPSHCFCSRECDGVNATKDGYSWSKENRWEVAEFMRAQSNSSEEENKGEVFDDLSFLWTMNDKGERYLQVRNNGDQVEFESQNLIEVVKFMSARSDSSEEENQGYVVLRKGEVFDVISLLSTTNDKGECYLVRNNGDRVEVESLRGKNIVVCCFFVPCFWLSSDPGSIREIITACSRLNNGSEGNGNYEMVMVARMRRNWANDEDAFNHFFSGFPSSWLAVPFSDKKRRDHVCNSIGLHSSGKPQAKLMVGSNQKVLIVDPNQKVLAVSLDGYYRDPDIWWKTHSELDSILDSDYVHKMYSNNTMVGIDGNDKVSISKLKDKLVGLYLCYDGSLIRTLDMVSQECKARNQEFHIVLVYLPYEENVHPPLFQEAINHVLHNLKVSVDSNWWVSPFNDFVSRMLLEVCPLYRDDQLVIVDPHMNAADPYGKQVLDWFGINSYPFTREFLVRRELEAVRAVTIESLLSYGSRDYVLRINDDDNSKTDQVPIAELRGKTVLLYIDEAEKLSRRYDTLLEWYNWTKTASVADFEVIFLHASPGSSPRPMPSWLMCPFDPKHLTYVVRKIFNNRLGSLTAFDKDGNVITLDAIDLLDAYGPKGFPLYDGLRNEITGQFEYYELDMEYDE